MEKIKVPPTIKIGSHTYSILFDEREEDNSLRGSALHRHHEMLLNPETHHQHLRVTFIHEAIHVVAQVFALDPSEEGVTRLAEGLGELLFNNLGIDLDFSEIPIRKVR